MQPKRIIIWIARHYSFSLSSRIDRFFAIGINSLICRFKTRKALKKCKINGEGGLYKSGELKTQMDRLKVRYSPKDIVRKPSVMDIDPQDDHATA